MRSNTIRIFIVIASVLIAVIIGLQVYWLERTYSFEKNEFNTAVFKSIRGVYEDIPLVKDPGTRMGDLVEKTNANGFIFRTDHLPIKDSLVYYLANEFDDFGLYTSCKIALYDANAGRYLFEVYHPGLPGHEQDVDIDLPVEEKAHSYVYLYFPDRNRYLIGQMTGWIITSVFLLLLLLGFAGALYYFFKQKFLVEVQQDFINNVTHEFSTPLSVIELAVEGLEKPTVLQQPDKHTQYTKAIKYQSEYLKQHITNLVNTVVAGKYNTTYRKAPVAPNTLLRKAALQLDSLLLKKKGVFEWALEPADTPVSGDGENLYLAFFNLLNNAIKYSDHPRVTIATRRLDNKYEISIGDNGIGIEAAHVKKIFQKFYRAEGGNVHSSKGLGLGLYFTKKVIDGHQGHIDVTSSPGNGTTFIIHLPI